MTRSTPPASAHAAQRAPGKLHPTVLEDPMHEALPQPLPGLEAMSMAADDRDLGVLLTGGERGWPSAETLRWRAHLVKHYEKERLPWNRARLAYELWRRDVYSRSPLLGNPLTMLREGRLFIGGHNIFEANVTLRSSEGRILLGYGVGINRNAVIASGNLVVLGDHTIVAQNCYITDVNHSSDDPDTPVGDQPMQTRGPTVIEDNVWLGANCIVTTGVRIGRRSIIGANSVVTRDVPPHSVVHGTAARARPRPDVRELG
jgi:acetyltransferase-like isoleucine patch superfamily enzyme